MGAEEKLSQALLLGFEDDAKILTTQALMDKYHISKSTVSKWKGILRDEGVLSLSKKRPDVPDDGKNENVCVFNAGVDCTERFKCGKCGWNPNKAKRPIRWIG